jgi:ABC-type uncharacterized transport system ATPase subunit
MSISYYDFKNMQKYCQHELVLSEGKVICETNKNELKIVLYDMRSFSVEIVYHTVTNKIASLSA